MSEGVHAQRGPSSAGVLPASPPRPPFEDFADVVSRIDEARFSALSRFARNHVDTLAWRGALAELELTPQDLVQAVAAGGAAPPAEPEHALFGGFRGSWIGGDITDTRRAYRHIWYPNEQQGRYLVQPVLMLPLARGGTPTIAYDAYNPDDEIALRGVVDGRPYVGYPLPGGALLWFGAERDGKISIHAERVVAAGRLYEIRGQVVRGAAARPGEPPEQISPSNWRYHRVADGAIDAALALGAKA